MASEHLQNVYHGESNITNYSYTCAKAGTYIVQVVVSCENRTPTVNISSTGTFVVTGYSELYAWRGFKEEVYKCNAGDTITLTVSSNGLCRQINILWTDKEITGLIHSERKTDTTLSYTYTLEGYEVICTQGVIGANTCTLTEPSSQDGTVDSINGSGSRCKWSISSIQGVGASFSCSTTSYNHGGNLICIYSTNTAPSNDWQPVSSITGKGETYTLAKIASESISGGSPVTGASSSDFDVLTDASLVSKLIADIMQDEKLVTVSYTMPSADYSYIKLVYKKGSMPADYTDGTAIDITQDSTSYAIDGIANGKTYWFVIFTDKTTSEPKEFTTAKYYGDLEWKTTDINHVQNGNWESNISALSSYYLTDYILCLKQHNGNYLQYFDGDTGYGRSATSGTGCLMFIPIVRAFVTNFKVKAGFMQGVTGINDVLHISLAYVENGTMKYIDNVNPPVSGLIAADRQYPLREFTYTVQNPHDADYVVIRTCDHQWRFEDMEFNYS